MALCTLWFCNVVDEWFRACANRKITLFANIEYMLVGPPARNSHRIWTEILNQTSKEYLIFAITKSLKNGFGFAIDEFLPACACYRYWTTLITG